MPHNSLRNLEMIERLFRDESTFQDIATDYDLTKERVRHIFISVFRVMQRPDLLDQGIELPDDDCFDLPVLRKNRELWLGQVEKLRQLAQQQRDDPLTAHLNNPVRLTKDLFFVNNYEAFKRAFIAFNNNRAPTAFEEFKTPEYFPCFVRISHSEKEGYMKFLTVSLPIVESMMENYTHYN